VVLVRSRCGFGSTLPGPAWYAASSTKSHAAKGQPSVSRIGRDTWVTNRVWSRSEMAITFDKIEVLPVCTSPLMKVAVIPSSRVNGFFHVSDSAVLLAFVRRSLVAAAFCSRRCFRRSAFAFNSSVVSGSEVPSMTVPNVDVTICEIMPLKTVPNVNE
jgi:hypothetical protein